MPELRKLCLSPASPLSLEQREVDGGAGPEQRQEDGCAGPKQSMSELGFEAFIRQHITAAEAEAQRGRPGHGNDDGGCGGDPGARADVFSPGGGLPGLCFGDSVSSCYYPEASFIAQPLLLYLYCSCV